MNADTSTVSNRVPEQDSDPNAVATENKSNWRSTASGSAKLLLRGVRECADVCGPLKAVTGGLCFILENCEVTPPPPYASTTLTGSAANEGEQASGGIADAPCRGACRISLQTCS